jgi:hypothetical protein
MELAFISCGPSKKKTYMRFKPMIGTKLPDWTRIYILAESQFASFERLVLTLTEKEAASSLSFVENGYSKNFRRYQGIANEHQPDFNQLYVPKNHEVAQHDEIHFIVSVVADKVAPQSKEKKSAKKKAAKKEAKKK